MFVCAAGLPTAARTTTSWRCIKLPIARPIHFAQRRNQYKYKYPRRLTRASALKTARTARI